VEREISGQHLRKRDMHDASHEGNPRFQMSIERRDLIGHKNTLVGQTNIGTRFFEAMSVTIKHFCCIVIIISKIDQERKGGVARRARA
jgi:hypothetical protein